MLLIRSVYVCMQWMRVLFLHINYSQNKSKGLPRKLLAGMFSTPTWTPDVYKCEFVDQDPLDGPQMTGWIYDVIWTMRNVGIANWTVAEYYVKWTGGDDLSPKHIYKLPHDVGYYEKVDIVVDIYIPVDPVNYPGYVTNWAIINDNGDVMCEFYHHITQTYPAPTKTPTP